MQVSELDVNNEKNVSKNGNLVINNIDYMNTMTPGDYVVFNSEPIAELFRSEMENDSEWDVVSLNWHGEYNHSFHNNTPCPTPASGQCSNHIVIMSFNITATNQTENRQMVFNFTMNQQELIPTTYTGWKYSIERSYQEFWMSDTMSGEQMMRGENWENSTSELYTSGWVISTVLGDMWDEQEQEWINSTSESLTTMKDPMTGTWTQPIHDSTADYEEDGGNYTYNAVDEKNVQINVYNQANASAAAPTTYPIIEVQQWNNDGKNPELESTLYLSEWGFPIYQEMDGVGTYVTELYHLMSAWVDDDNDQVHDSLDLCPNTPAGATVDQDGCAWEQKDDDGDGVYNPSDNCNGTTPTMTQIDAQGCAYEQRDDDNDGVLNPEDQCQNTNAGDQVPTEPPNAGCSLHQLDSDDDTVSDANDTCDGHNDTIDLDQDGTPDGCDDIVDSDNDGVADSIDTCPGHNDTIDLDQDGIPDGCDDIIDSDGDGVADSADECNGFDDNIDADGDNIIDGCDDIVDSDNDGVADPVDECPGFDDNIDLDGDQIIDGCDNLVDSDNDGVSDSEDKCEGHNDALDFDSDGIPDGCDNLNDSDGDGVANVNDKCPGYDDSVDIDGDQIPDSCDDLIDNDKDGVANENDQCPNTAEGIDVDDVGCKKSATSTVASGGFDPMIGGVVAGIFISIIIVGLLMFRKGRSNTPQQDFFQDGMQKSGLEGRPSKAPSSHNFAFPGPVSAESQGPHPSQTGKLEADGYEYLEHPPNSGNWWYRNQQTSHWEKWDN